MEGLDIYCTSLFDVYVLLSKKNTSIHEVFFVVKGVMEMEIDSSDDETFGERGDWINFFFHIPLRLGI